MRERVSEREREREKGPDGKFLLHEVVPAEQRMRESEIG
jgi:hypothetical protein